MVFAGVAEIDVGYAAHDVGIEEGLVDEGGSGRTEVVLMGRLLLERGRGNGRLLAQNAALGIVGLIFSE